MKNALSRRAFFAGMGAAAAVSRASADQFDVQQRRDSAFQFRERMAAIERDLTMPVFANNGDEAIYPNKIANFSKGLQHNQLGEVNLDAYYRLIGALTGGSASDMENLVLGSEDPRLQMKLVNPLSGLAYALVGADPAHTSMPAPPAFNSPEAAGEVAELYWQALARDIPFTEYDTNPLTQAAAADLSKLSNFRGAKTNGAVTTGTLFRGFTSGDLAGPYVSQFLLRPVPYGPQVIEQLMRATIPGSDYATEYAAWLALQNGVSPQQPDKFDRTRRFPRNGRDLAQRAHMDVLFQHYLNAAAILFTPPDSTDEITGGGIGAPLNAGNPYNTSRTQTGFGTFGAPHISSALAEVASSALRAVWYHKWYVHRRLRPEAFGGRVHNLLTRQVPDYPIHGDLLNSGAVALTFSKHGTYLLPQAYPEGCPLHPSYGAGHAVSSGACVTILKAFFDESFVIPNPVTASPDGLTLVPYTGPSADRLTVGGELNKLAANVAMGRNFAGIHYRSDYAQSLLLGERVALRILADQRAMYGEDFAGFTFTTFDGTKVTA